MYLSEIGSIPFDKEDRRKNKRLGAKVFVGQLTLHGLVLLEDTDVLTDDQQVRVSAITDQFKDTDFYAAFVSLKGRKGVKDIMVEVHKRTLRTVEAYDKAIARTFGRKMEDRESRLNNFIGLAEVLVSEGVKAYNELIVGNLRLVVSIAKRFLGRGFTLDDLVQEGNIGLQRAAAMYNFRSGFVFSTYATWWIRQSISRAISDKSTSVRLPVHIREIARKYAGIYNDLTDQSGHLLKDYELKAVLDQKDWDKMCEVRRALGMVNLRSLDQEIHFEDNDPDTTIGDLVRDPNVNVEEQAFRMMVGGDVRKALLVLAFRERQVLELRFGLEDGRSRTLEEVGRKINVTRERVRQIETKALGKLRNVKSLRVLAR